MSQHHNHYRIVQSDLDDDWNPVFFYTVQRLTPWFCGLFKKWKNVVLLIDRRRNPDDDMSYAVAEFQEQAALWVKSQLEIGNTPTITEDYEQFGSAPYPLGMCTLRWPRMYYPFKKDMQYLRRKFAFVT